MIDLVIVALTNALFSKCDDEMIFQQTLWMTVIYYYLNLAYTFVMNAYFLLLLAVKSRLAILNNCIRYKCKDINVIIPYKPPFFYRRNFITPMYLNTTLVENGITENFDARCMIRHMAMTYDHLVDTVETINICFSIQVIYIT